MNDDQGILQFRCNSCGANLSTATDHEPVTHPRVLSQLCPFCQSAQVAPWTSSAVPPEVVLAFGFGADQARNAVRRYLKSRPLAPRREVVNAPLSGFRGVYVPAYLYSATAECGYSATIIESYVTTEKDPQTQETNSTSHPYTVPFEGSARLRVRDILVSASPTVSDSVFEALKPFDLKLLRRYSANLLLGFWAEQHTGDLSKRTQVAQQLAKKDCDGRVTHLLPGDDHKELSCKTTLKHEVMDPVLIPVWLFSIPVGAQKNAVVYVNGQTGACFGDIPASPWAVFWGIMGFVVFMLAVGLLIYGVVLWW